MQVTNPEFLNDLNDLHDNHDNHDNLSLNATSVQMPHDFRTTIAFWREM